MKTNQEALEEINELATQPKLFKWRAPWVSIERMSIETFKTIRKALTANTWRDIDEKTPRNTDILLSGHEFNKPENRRFVCQGLIETRGNALAYGFDGMEDCQFADKWQPLPEQPPC